MINKFIARVLLFFIVFSQLQVGDLYVSAKQEVLSVQNNSVQELETLEQAFDTSIKKVDKKLKNKQKKQKLKQKQKEIKKLMKDAKKALKKEKNKETLKKIKNNAKNRALLKMTSGVLDYKNIEDNLKGELKDNKNKRAKALKTLKKSLKQANNYSVMIAAELSKKEIVKKYKTFDEKIKVKKLYNKGKKKYFLLTFRKNSILQEELFENIESGELPDNFLGIKVIQPEIFTIDSLNLEGENISQTWGIEKYATYTHFDNIDTSKKVRVGVIDTGIASNHPDLQANVVAGYDFVNNDSDATDDQGHGTHVAGTVGANINGLGIIGVNPHVELVPLKICDENGYCPSYAITQALAYSQENNIDVINMSLGGRANPEGHAICDGINAYKNNGGIAIVAAGNSNIDASQFVPGGCREAITVGAVDQNNQKTVFSNYGNVVDLVAPGVDIYSTSLNNNYKKLSGTSMAAPHITGVISLLSQGGVPHNSIETVLQNYTDQNNILDVQELLKNNIAPDDSNTPPIEEPTEPVTEDNNDDANKNEAVINPDVVFIENQEELDTKVIDYPEAEKPILVNTTLKNQIIDFGDESIAVNNIGETTEIIDIEETLESKKEYFIPGDKYFNADGEISAQEFGVNSIDNSSPTQSYKIDGDFDYKNIDFSQYDFSYEKEENIEINSFDENIQNKIDTTGFKPLTIQKNPISIDHDIEIDLSKNLDGIGIQNIPEHTLFIGEGKVTVTTYKGHLVESNPGLLSYRNYSKYAHVRGINPGTTTIEYRSSKTGGRAMTKYKFNILSIPIPEEFTLDIRLGGEGTIELPEDISNYTAVGTGSSYFDQILINNNTIYVDTDYNVAGVSPKIYFRDENNHDIYILTVNITPHEETYNIHPTDRIDVWGHDSYTFNDFDPTIAKYHSYNDAILEGIGSGTTDIIIKKDNRYHRKTWHINVTPIPEPTEIICNAVVGDWCKFNIRNGGHVYTESKNNVIEMKDRQQTVGLKTISSGQATVYVKSPNGDYFTHILKINVSAEPPVIKICETPQGLACETKRYDKDEGYTFAVSAEAIVDLQLIRYWKDGVRTSDETLYLEGVQEGTVDVYVYKNGDHITTFKTTILPPITPIHIDDKIITLKQTENQIVQVSGGGGEYMILGEDSNIAYVDVDKYTGELEISAKNPGSYYPIVTDKYDQKESFKVVVEDVQLVLDTYEVELKVGERQYVYIYESYYGVQLEATNDNIRAYRTTFTSGDKAITVVGEKPGITVLRVTDSEGNERTVNVTVTGTVYNPDPGTDPDPGTGSGSTGSGNGEDNLSYLIEELFGEYDVAYDGVQITSAINSYSCELGNTGITYIRPFNATCVENDNNHAWKCNEGFIDLDTDSNGFINSCVSQDFYHQYYDPHYAVGYQKLIKNWINLFSTERKNKLYAALVNLGEKKVDYSVVYGTKKGGQLQYIVDMIKSEIQQIEGLEFKDYYELKLLWRDIQLASDNGSYGCLECIWDITDPNLSGKSPEEIKEMIGEFSVATINYHLKHNSEFKTNYDAEVEKYVVEGGLIEDIELGVKEGLIEGTKDYFVAYYEAYESLKNVKFEDIQNGINKIWGFVLNPIDSIESAYQYAKTFTSELYDKILVLTGYEASKGGTYVGTTLGLSSADPAAKLIQLAGGGLFVKMGGKVDDLIKWPKPRPGGATIDGIWYSEHSLARMQPLGEKYLDSKGDLIEGRGIPTTVVKNTLDNGVKTTGTRPNTIDITYDNIFITVSDDLKRVITVIKKSGQ